MTNIVDKVLARLLEPEQLHNLEVQKQISDALKSVPKGELVERVELEANNRPERQLGQLAPKFVVEVILVRLHTISRVRSDSSRRVYSLYYKDHVPALNLIREELL